MKSTTRTIPGHRCGWFPGSGCPAGNAVWFHIGVPGRSAIDHSRVGREGRRSMHRCRTVASTANRLIRCDIPGQQSARRRSSRNPREAPSRIVAPPHQILPPVTRCRPVGSRCIGIRRSGAGQGGAIRTPRPVRSLPTSHCGGGWSKPPNSTHVPSNQNARAHRTARAPARTGCSAHSAASARP